MLAKNPYIVFIWIGVNDVWHKLQGTGTETGKFENIYEAVIKRFQAQNIKVILVTPALIGEKRDNTNKQDADLDRYAEMIRQMSSQYDCRLVDIRKDFVEYENKNNRDNKNSGILTLDGVHLSAKGNQLAAEKMMEVLEPILKSTISN